MHKTGFTKGWLSLEQITNNYQIYKQGKYASHMLIKHVDTYFSGFTLY